MRNICSACGSDNSDTAKFCNECGQTLGAKAGKENKSKPVTLKQGAALKGNRYIIKRLIKSGGMGAVYEAADKKVNKIFAIKELWTYATTSAEKEYLIKRFESEANLLSKLVHISLPKVYDYFIDNERYYLVMDFIKGRDLDNLIREQGKPGLPQEEVIKWGIQVCEVLEYLHTSDPPIIYRDLKPSNIMLRSSDNRIVLIDFGIACALEDNASGNPRTMIGTMGYIAPEQYLGKPVPASDIYSLGGTLYNLLTGSMPVPFSYKPMRSIVPEIAVGIEEIVSISLNLKVEDRYQTVREVKTILEKVLASEILALKTLKEKPKLSRWKMSGELPELSDISQDLPASAEEIQSLTLHTDHIEDKDTKEMEGTKEKIKENAEVTSEEIDEVDEQEDKNKIYIDLLEELLNKDRLSLVATIKSNKKLMDKKFFEIFDDTLQLLKSEDTNLFKDLIYVNEVISRLKIREPIKKSEDNDEVKIEVTRSNELFDEDFIDYSSNLEENDLSEEIITAEEPPIEVKSESSYDTDKSEDTKLTPEEKKDERKKDELFDEDFIDFSSDSEELEVVTETGSTNSLEPENLSYENDIKERDEVFDSVEADDSNIEENMPETPDEAGDYERDKSSSSEEFTEENIIEIFSTDENLEEDRSVYKETEEISVESNIAEDYVEEEFISSPSDNEKIDDNEETEEISVESNIAEDYAEEEFIPSPSDNEKINDNEETEEISVESNIAEGYAEEEFISSPSDNEKIDDNEYYDFEDNFDDHIKDNKKQNKENDILYDMLDEDMIMSNSWELDEETIDLNLNIDAEENIILSGELEDKEEMIRLPVKEKKKNGKKQTKDVKEGTFVTKKAVITGEKKVRTTDKKEEAQKLFEKAQILLEEKNVEGAVKSCEKALDYDPDFLDVHYTLGTLYKQINRSDMAVESYKKYLSLKQKKAAESLKIKGKK